MKRLSSAVCLALTFGHLLAGRREEWTQDQELVLAALRRSTRALEAADDEALANYLPELTTDQMRGVLSNVKGIFHELLVVRSENADGDDMTARLLPWNTEVKAGPSMCIAGRNATVSAATTVVDRISVRARS